MSRCAVASTDDRSAPARAANDVGVGVDGADNLDDRLDARLREAHGSSDSGRWEDLAADLCEQWRLEEAEACARRALDLGRPAAAFYLALACERQDRHVEAVEAYEVAISANVAAALVNQGAVWQFLGQRERARQRYQEAIEADDPLGHIRMGQLHEADGNLASAEENYRLALAKEWPSAQSRLGIVLAKQERWAEAEPLLGQAATDGEDADARS